MSHNLIIPMHTGMSGRFKVRRVKAESGLVVEESGWSGNLLVNGFFDDMLAGSATGRYVHGFVVGTGTNAPAETDTALQAFLAGFNGGVSTSVVRNSTVAPRYVTRRYTMRSTQGGVVGNVSEIGVTMTSSPLNPMPAPTNASRLWSRARILDTGGVPTTLTVLSDEFLEAVWELTIFASPVATGVLNVNLLGTPTNIDYELRPIHMQSQALWQGPTAVSTVGNGYYDSAALGLMPLVNANNSNGVSRAVANAAFESYDGTANSTPADQSSSTNQFQTTTLGAYTAGSKTRSSVIHLPLPQGNYAAPGIRSFYISHGNLYNAPVTTHQLLLATGIHKLPTQLFDLTLVQTLANTAPPA